MATPKQRFRMPGSRWQAVMSRAQREHHADATKVFNALAESYAAGELDPVVTAWLPRVSPGGDKHPESEPESEPVSG